MFSRLRCRRPRGARAHRDVHGHGGRRRRSFASGAVRCDSQVVTQTCSVASETRRAWRSHHHMRPQRHTGDAQGDRGRADVFPVLAWSCSAWHIREESSRIAEAALSLSPPPPGHAMPVAADDAGLAARNVDDASSGLRAVTQKWAASMSQRAGLASPLPSHSTMSLSALRIRK